MDSTRHRRSFNPSWEEQRLGASFLVPINKCCVIETHSAGSAAEPTPAMPRCRHAQHLTTDRGSQFMALKTQGKFSHVALITRLQYELCQGGIPVTVVPASDHSANSMAEQVIRSLREMPKEVFGGRTHSILQLQTFVSFFTLGTLKKTHLGL